jgi:hypothetical protein
LEQHAERRSEQVQAQYVLVHMRQRLDDHLRAVPHEDRPGIGPK